MSSDKDWKRARKPNQKALRRQAILDAAKSLFSTSAYEEVSLNGIAREAGMSKPNIYRYFASKEEIFLLLLAEEQVRFVEGLQTRLEAVRGEGLVEQIVDVWVEESLNFKDLSALLPQLGLSIEKNSSVEQLVLYKKDAFERMGELAAQHHEVYPKLTVERWAEVISIIFALKSGLWPLCQNGETVLAAMRHPDVSQEPWEFSPKMQFALKALILGAAQS